MNFNQLYYLHFAILMPRLLLYSNSGVLSSSSSSSSSSSWNKISDAKVNLWDILTYKQAKIKFKN